MHGLNKSSKCNLHVPNVNLTIYPKGVIQYRTVQYSAIVVSFLLGKSPASVY